MSCTADDHDTTDMFCAACGEQLHEAGQCDWCERGQHEGDGSPFCPCCGFRRVAACTDNQPFREGDQVRVVAGAAPFGGRLGEVREWDGSAYQVLVRNKVGFPWYVQLSPTQVEAVNQPQEDT